MNTDKVRIKRNITTCYCEAYPFPHRLGGGNCHENMRCGHGNRTYDHPDYDSSIDYCDACDKEARADWMYDCWKDK